MNRIDAERELSNWGRAVNDAWLHDFLTYSHPPTSDGYIAPNPAYDECAVEAHIHVDELAAEITSRIVAEIGREDFDSYNALVHWYCRLMVLNEYTFTIDPVKRLSKHLHCNYAGAKRMLDEAIQRYLEKRKS